MMYTDPLQDLHDEGIMSHNFLQVVGEGIMVHNFLPLYGSNVQGGIYNSKSLVTMDLWSKNHSLDTDDFRP